MEPDHDAEAAGVQQGVDPVEREHRRNATQAALQMDVGDDTADMSQDDEMDDMSLSMVLVGAALLLCGQGSGAWFHRRRVFRNAGGPFNSTIAGYLCNGDDITYLLKFRMTIRQLWDASRALAENGFLCDNSGNRDPMYRYPGRFKFAICMYVVAHGANGSQEPKAQ